MYFNVPILSTEIIKPYSPTPPEKRIYKRSLLDQLTPLVDIDCVLFYPNALKLSPTKQMDDNLKISLSKALADFYPLAGRANDALSISCNDLGVRYTKARVPCDMSRLIMNLGATNRPLLELIPKEQLTNLVDEDDGPLLSVQISTFTCGGLAIGVKVSHAIVDASAFTSFLVHWAGISQDPASRTLEGIVVDWASMFPPRDLPVVHFSDLIFPEKAQTERVVKRFVFDGQKITSLQKRFQNRVTRFEALATLLWAALVNISQDPFDENSNKSHVAFPAMNLRKRINPPLPGQSLGSTIHFEIVEWPMNKAVDLDEMAGKLVDSIRIRNDSEAYRELYSDEKYLNALQSSMANSANLGILISSWSRFPFYDTDFGFGKPELVATTYPLNIINAAIFMDAKDGEGIEVWMGLLKEDMARFEQDPGILEYASFSLTSTSTWKE